MKPFLLFTAFLGIVTGAAAQSFDAAKADSLLDRLNRHHKAMGAVSIYQEGKPVYQRGFGYAVTEKDIPNTPETIFRIGSVTKTFTAALVFKLIDEKQLRLEDRLSKWYPVIPNADSITIGQLLSHRSGIANYTEKPDFQTWIGTPRTQQEILARLGKDTPDFKPGTKTEYSNTNYLLLGYIIEKVTGKEYCQALQQKILQPLHLKNTACNWPKNAQQQETKSYSWDGEKWEMVPSTPWFAAGAAGGLYSSLPDLNTFITVLLEGKLVSKEAVEQMKKQQGGLGYGLIRIPFGKRYAYGHGGFIDNFSSMTAYFPEEKMSISVALNATNTNFNDLMIGLLSIYFGEEYQLPEFDKEVSVPVATLQQYEGVYRYDPIDMDITVRLEGTQLTAQATGQGAFPLTAQTHASFSFEAAGIVIDFQKIENGKAQVLMLHQGGSNIPFERKE